MSELNIVTRIKVFGVGGGGCNAVNRMVDANLVGVTFYVCNTDKQDLNSSRCENKIILGEEITHGLGAGGIPEVGRQAALASANDIKEAVKDADMIFITTGLGGGTGTGAAPVIAQIAKETGALVIGVCTKPFMFEGKKRMMQAINGLDELRKNVDSLIIVPNEKVKDLLGSIPFNQSFLEADNVLRQAVQTITDLVGYKANINLDFADIKSTLAGEGTALIGVGQVSANEVSSKEEMSVEAARRAINCPLLEADIKGAKKAIINITGGDVLTLDDVSRAIEYIEEAAGNDIEKIFGIAQNDALKDSIIVTIIATGFDQQPTGVILTNPEQNINIVDQEKVFEPKQQGINVKTTTREITDIPDFFSRRNN